MCPETKISHRRQHVFPKWIPDSEVRSVANSVRDQKDLAFLNCGERERESQELLMLELRVGMGNVTWLLRHGEENVDGDSRKIRDFEILSARRPREYFARDTHRTLGEYIYIIYEQETSPAHDNGKELSVVLYRIVSYLLLSRKYLYIYIYI